MLAVGSIVFVFLVYPEFSVGNDFLNYHFWDTNGLPISPTKSAMFANRQLPTFPTLTTMSPQSTPTITMRTAPKTIPTPPIPPGSNNNSNNLWFNVQDILLKSPAIKSLPGYLIHEVKKFASDVILGEDNLGENGVKQFLRAGERLTKFLDNRIKYNISTPMSEVTQQAIREMREAVLSVDTPTTDDSTNEQSDDELSLERGLGTLRKLRNAMEENYLKSLSPEKRDGYYGGGGGSYWPAGVYGYGGFLDPYALLAALGFGVFLFQVVYNIINRSARSLDVMDFGIPLALSDAQESLTSLLPGEGRGDDVMGWKDDFTSRKERDLNDVVDDSEMTPGILFLSTLLSHAEGYVRLYREIQKNPKCARSYVCSLVSDDTIGDGAGGPTQLILSALGQFFGDSGVAKFADDLQTSETFTSHINCTSVVQKCI